MELRMKESWEVELDNNMESIRKSYKSIRLNYYIIMTIMVVWGVSSIIGSFIA